MTNTYDEIVDLITDMFVSDNEGKAIKTVGLGLLAQAEQARITNLLSIATARDLASGDRTAALVAASKALGLKEN